MSEQAKQKTNLAPSPENTTLENMMLEQLLAKFKEENHPWLPAIGIFQDDAVHEGWQQAIQDYRRSVDEDPQAL